MPILTATRFAAPRAASQWHTAWDRTFGVELEVVVPQIAPDGRDWTRPLPGQPDEYMNPVRRFLRYGVYPALEAIGDFGSDSWSVQTYPDTARIPSGWQYSDVWAGWNFGDDGSVHGRNVLPMEIRSPILDGHGGFRRLRRFIRRVLLPLGVTVNSTCGTHVHLGVADLEPAAFKRLVRSYHRSYDAFNSLVANRNGRRNTWAPRWSEATLDHLDNIPDEQFLAHLTNGYADNYGALTTRAYPRHGTVEVRHHHGTLNYARLERWVRLLLRFAQACKRADAPITAGSLEDLLRAARIPSAERAWYLLRAQELELPRSTRTLGYRREV